MNPPPMYPLRFDPIYEHRPWGGRRLADLLAEPLPGKEAVGEAWMLSDRDDHPSRVSNGPLAGRSLHQLLLDYPHDIMGDIALQAGRFPLLLKFLDVRTALSVQVHPSTRQACDLPAGETGKTEAWVVLRTGEHGRVYAGLKPGNTAATLQEAITDGALPAQLQCFNPEPGESILIPARTVHALADVVVFEVQQNSDTTFRLFDWDSVDAATGKPRALQVEKALACINFDQVPLRPRRATREDSTSPGRELLLSSDYFRLWQVRGESPAPVGAVSQPRALVCTEGVGHLDHGECSYDVRAGQVWLIPAQVGVVMFRPAGPATLLEVEVPTR